MESAIAIIETIIKNLASIVTAAASIWVAVVATRALQTWKHQTRAEKHTHFMDELADTVHEYIQAMGPPIEIISHIELAIEAQNEVAAIRHPDVKNAGLITYIRECGKADKKRLSEHLSLVRPIASKLSSLATKGHVMGFSNYNECHDACKMLVWPLSQIASVVMIIGNTNWNWDNPQVQATTEKVLAIKSKSINENIEKHHKMLMDFLQHNYQKLLG